MSKKKRKNKRVLGKKKPTKNLQETPAMATDVRSDLRKAATLTGVCLGILALLLLTQSRWSP